MVETERHRQDIHSSGPQSCSYWFCYWRDLRARNWCDDGVAAYTGRKRFGSSSRLGSVTICSGCIFFIGIPASSTVSCLSLPLVQNPPPHLTVPRLAVREGSPRNLKEQAARPRPLLSQTEAILRLLDDIAFHRAENAQQLVFLFLAHLESVECLH